MAPSNRKVQFRLENVKEELEDENQQSFNNDNKRGPIAITKRPAFELPTSHNQQNDPLTIKEQYRPDLKRLSLDDLKGLIEKQQRILRNRYDYYWKFFHIISSLIIRKKIFQKTFRQSQG